MSFTLKFCLQRSFLTRLLQTTGLSLALMTASAVGVHAETVTDVGANGANGANGVNPGDPGQQGGDGGSAAADAEGVSPNKAMATGGNGGGGGVEGGFNRPFRQSGAPGGRGGDATATAGTTIISGSAEADAVSSGGWGGTGGGFDGDAARAGDGGSASSFASGFSGSGNATVSAVATGGFGGVSDTFGGNAGDAYASSAASTKGSGSASSSANATGGAGGSGGDTDGGVGNATAIADASAAGGGTAIATAVATQGIPGSFNRFPVPIGTANATSSAETTNGARAEALSTGGGVIGETQSTAKTSLGGVTVQSTVMAPSMYPFSFGPAMTTDAIAQGGSGPTFGEGGADAFAIATVLPDEAYAATLIGGASNVADALLGPGDEIFGTAILAGEAFGAQSATFDFSFRGDLILGDVDDNSVIKLGFFSGPIHLTLEDPGISVLGGVVPEPSTWAMMLLGFAGLGFAGYRSVGRGSARTFSDPRAVR